MGSPYEAHVTACFIGIPQYSELLVRFILALYSSRTLLIMDGLNIAPGQRPAHNCLARL